MGNCYTSKIKVDVAVDNAVDVAVDVAIDNEVDIVAHRTIQLTHTYDIAYPEHTVCKLSTLYINTRREMIKNKIPCFICGTRKSCHAVHMYIHPQAQNAIDWELFGEYASNCTNIQSGNSLNQFDWNAVADNPELFVDSPQNMIMLCDTHYTGCGGLKRIPFPDWILDKFAIQEHTFITTKN